MACVAPARMNELRINPHATRILHHWARLRLLELTVTTSARVPPFRNALEGPLMALFCHHVLRVAHAENNPFLIKRHHQSLRSGQQHEHSLTDLVRAM